MLAALGAGGEQRGGTGDGDVAADELGGAALAAAVLDAARRGAADVDRVGDAQLAGAGVAGAQRQVAAERGLLPAAQVELAVHGDVAPGDDLDRAAGVAGADVDQGAAADGRVEAGLDADVAATGLADRAARLDQSRDDDRGGRQQRRRLPAAAVRRGAVGADAGGAGDGHRTGVAVEADQAAAAAGHERAGRAVGDAGALHDGAGAAEHVDAAAAAASPPPEASASVSVTVPSARSSTNPPSRALTSSFVWTRMLPPALRLISPPPSESDPPRARTALEPVRVMSPGAVRSIAAGRAVVEELRQQATADGDGGAGARDDLAAGGIAGGVDAAPLLGAEGGGGLDDQRAAPRRLAVADGVDDAAGGDRQVAGAQGGGAASRLRRPVSATARVPKSSVQPSSTVYVREIVHEPLGGQEGSVAMMSCAVQMAAAVRAMPSRRTARARGRANGQGGHGAIPSRIRLRRVNAPEIVGRGRARAQLLSGRPAAGRRRAGTLADADEVRGRQPDAALRIRRHVADHLAAVAVLRGNGEGALGPGRRHHHRQAGAHVEGSVHLRGAGLGGVLDEGEDRLRRQRAIDDEAHRGGDARQVEQAVAGDVQQRLHRQVGVEHRHGGPDVEQRRLEQLVAEGAAELGDAPPRERPARSSRAWRARV